jgi:hypothetical protein
MSTSCRGCLLTAAIALVPFALGQGPINPAPDRGGLYRLVIKRFDYPYPLVPAFPSVDAFVFVLVTADGRVLLKIPGIAEPLQGKFDGTRADVFAPVTGKEFSSAPAEVQSQIPTMYPRRKAMLFLRSLGGNGTLEMPYAHWTGTTLTRVEVFTHSFQLERPFTTIQSFDVEHLGFDELDLERNVSKRNLADAEESLRRALEAMETAERARESAKKRKEECQIASARASEVASARELELSRAGNALKTPEYLRLEQRKGAIDRRLPQIVARLEELPVSDRTNLTQRQALTQEATALEAELKSTTTRLKTLRVSLGIQAAEDGALASLLKAEEELWRQNIELFNASTGVEVAERAKKAAEELATARRHEKTLAEQRDKRASGLLESVRDLGIPIVKSMQLEVPEVSHRSTFFSAQRTDVVDHEIEIWKKQVEAIDRLRAPVRARFDRLAKELIEAGGALEASHWQSFFAQYLLELIGTGIDIALAFKDGGPVAMLVEAATKLVQIAMGDRFYVDASNFGSTRKLDGGISDPLAKRMQEEAAKDALKTFVAAPSSAVLYSLIHDYHRATEQEAERAFERAFRAYMDEKYVPVLVARGAGPEWVARIRSAALENASQAARREALEASLLKATVAHSEKMAALKAFDNVDYRKGMVKRLSVDIGRGIALEATKTALQQKAADFFEGKAWEAVVDKGIQVAVANEELKSLGAMYDMALDHLRMYEGFSAEVIANVNRDSGFLAVIDRAFYVSSEARFYITYAGDRVPDESRFKVSLFVNGIELERINALQFRIPWETKDVSSIGYEWNVVVRITPVKQL